MRTPSCRPALPAVRRLQPAREHPRARPEGRTGRRARASQGRRRRAAAKPAKPDDEDGCIYKDANTPHDAECPSHDAMPGRLGHPGHFGAEFALKDPKPLSSVLAAAKDQKDPILVSGTVDSVCQKKGCWLVVKDGEAQARIMMKDHAFTAPMDCKGKNVVVEGTLEARTFSEAQVKHLEKDAGKDPAAVTGERVEYVLTATGIELKS
jgi:hypothetical protein